MRHVIVVVFALLLQLPAARTSAYTLELVFSEDVPPGPTPAMLRPPANSTIFLSVLLRTDELGFSGSIDVPLIWHEVSCVTKADCIMRAWGAGSSNPILWAEQWLSSGGVQKLVSRPTFYPILDQPGDFTIIPWTSPDSLAFDAQIVDIHWQGSVAPNSTVSIAEIMYANPIPEPQTGTLLLIGLTALALRSKAASWSSSVTP